MTEKWLDWTSLVQVYDHFGSRHFRAKGRRGGSARWMHGCRTPSRSRRLLILVAKGCGGRLKGGGHFDGVCRTTGRCNRSWVIYWSTRRFGDRESLGRGVQEVGYRRVTSGSHGQAGETHGVCSCQL